MTTEIMRRIAKLKEESLVIEKGNAYSASASKDTKRTINTIDDLTSWWSIR